MCSGQFGFRVLGVFSSFQTATRRSMPAAMTVPVADYVLIEYHCVPLKQSNAGAATKRKVAKLIPLLVCLTCLCCEQDAAYLQR